MKQPHPIVRGFWTSSALPVLAALAFTASAAIGFTAFAQSVPEDIDLKAIRARAAQNAADAEALADTVRKRASAMSEVAQKAADQGAANGQRYTDAARRAAPHASNGAFDFDRLIADAGGMTSADMGAAPRFIAFASFSMPPSALKAMMRDVTRAGGVVVFRGFAGGSAAGLATALRQILEPGERRDGIGIDPRLFRAFNISAVPAYVMASSDFDLCDGFDCANSVPPHDRIAGNVTAQYALETFARGAGPGARLAALHLARLEEEKP